MHICITQAASVAIAASNSEFTGGNSARLK